MAKYGTRVGKKVAKEIPEPISGEGKEAFAYFTGVQRRFVSGQRTTRGLEKEKRACALF